MYLKLELEFYMGKPLALIFQEEYITVPEIVEKFAQTYHTINEALCNRFGANNIIYEPGVTYAPAHHDNWWEENKPEIGKAVAAAHQADVIVACI